MAGIPILGCLPGSPAERVGLEYGDILLSVNGRPMVRVQDFLDARAEKTDALEILVQRGHQLLELSVDLRQAPQHDAGQVLAAVGKLNPKSLLPGVGEPEPVN